jgi:hypothetical protein
MELVEARFVYECPYCGSRRVYGSAPQVLPRCASCRQKRSRQGVALTFSVTMEYTLGVQLDLPVGCTSADVFSMIEEGDIDWLEEINQQHTDPEIQRAGRVEHRQLLSVDLHPLNREDDDAAEKSDSCAGQEDGVGDGSRTEV